MGTLAAAGIPVADIPAEDIRPAGRLDSLHAYNDVRQNEDERKLQWKQRRKNPAPKNLAIPDS